MNLFKKLYSRIIKKTVWARPQMSVIFRAEVMPGRNREERTFQIENVLPNNRVSLRDFAGEHRESEFEPVTFEK